MRRRVVLLTVREAVFVDVDVVVLNAPQLLREHVRVLAIATGAIDDDRLGLLLRIAALFEKFLHLLVDVGFPHRERTRTGDVTLLVNRGATRVEEENFFVVELFDGVVRDFDVWLVGVGGELLLRGCGGVARLWWWGCCGGGFRWWWRGDCGCCRRWCGRHRCRCWFGLRRRGRRRSTRSWDFGGVWVGADDCEFALAAGDCVRDQRAEHRGCDQRGCFNEVLSPVHHRLRRRCVANVTRSLHS